MTDPLLSRLRIVLVEPAGALNLGSVARVMKNTGLMQLVLVNPHCLPSDADARLMAVHAADVLDSAQLVDSLPKALIGCHRAVATTARDRNILDSSLEHPRYVLPWLLGQETWREKTTSEISEIKVTPSNTPSKIRLESALIFGPEDRGLSNTELSYAQRCLRIPTSPIYPSLNLAQAVAICCYELYQQSILPSKYRAHDSDVSTLDYSSDSKILASFDEVEGLYRHLEETLIKIGYLYPHTADSRMKKFRRLFNRTNLSPDEVSMLRGILRQMTWSLNQGNLDGK